MLTRDQFLSASDLKSEVVEVPEWGGSVTISTMTGAARDEWESGLVDSKTAMQNVRARLFAATCVDENGNRMFTHKDVDALGKKSVAALDRCIKVAQRLNRLTSEDLDDLAKN
jgi:hypothetical protein